jgi:hypothetical protein
MDMSTAQTPPTQPVRVVGTQRKAWPTVIGVLCIILGVCGVLAYGCLGSVQSIMSGVVAASFEEMAQADPDMQGQAAQLRVSRDYMWVSLASNLIAGGLGVLLVIAGIGLAGRNPWGARLCVTWSILKIIYAVGAVLLAFWIGRETMRAMQESAEPAPVSLILMLVGRLGMIGAVLQLLWLWLGPVLLLVWFGRPSVRREVADWKRAPQAPKTV